MGREWGDKRLWCQWLWWWKCYLSLVYFGLGEGKSRGGVEWSGRGGNLWVFAEVEEEGHGNQLYPGQWGLQRFSLPLKKCQAPIGIGGCGAEWGVVYFPFWSVSTSTWTPKKFLSVPYSKSMMVGCTACEIVAGVRVQCEGLQPGVEWLIFVLCVPPRMSLSRPLGCSHVGMYSLGW